jgi:tetratricopeptide (TPR) repeat protein
MKAMTNPATTPPAPPAKRPRDVRWRALLLTVALIVGGGLVLEWSDRLPSFGNDAKLKHAQQKRREEIDQRFQQGVVMLHARQYDHALTAFHRVLELAPNMPEAHVNIGFALLGKGEFKAAADFFDEATTLNKDQINAYYGLAVALDGMGQRRAAIEAMRAYLHRAPTTDPYRRKAEAAVWEWQAALGPQPPR